MEYEEFVRGCNLGVFPSYYEPWGYTPGAYPYGIGDKQRESHLFKDVIAEFSSFLLLCPCDP